MSNAIFTGDLDSAVNGSAARLARQLQAELRDHGIRSDVFPFVSGRVAVSVGPDLLPLTDGERIWWPIPGVSRRGLPRSAVYRTVRLAAERLAAQAAAQPAGEALDACPQ